LSGGDRAHFHFALGKALEDAGSYVESFEHYAAGKRAASRQGRIRRRRATTDFVQRAKRLFRKEFFAAREDFGAPSADPIFIVGLPRAGSTLVEQILASHSQVEGTMELPDIMAMAAELGGNAERSQESAYPEALAALSAAECGALGERYIEQTRVQRKTANPSSSTRCPIISCISGSSGSPCRTPESSMRAGTPWPAAFRASSRISRRDSVTRTASRTSAGIIAITRSSWPTSTRFLPGRIHRVIHENLVDDTEAEVRRLFEFCRLPFEPATLRFYDNERAVRTASSQQVRKPIYREGMDQWRHYEPCLVRCSTRLARSSPPIRMCRTFKIAASMSYTCRRDTCRRERIQNEGDDP